MVQIINIVVGIDHFVRCSTEVIARDGEGLAHRFVIEIPEKLADLWAYLDFKLTSGEKYKTARLPIENNVITYDIPAYVLGGNGVLKTQLVLQDGNGLTWKSNTKKFTVRYSINAEDDIPEKEDFIAEAQKLLDDIREGASGGGGYVVVDAELSTTSKNPVQNRVVTEKFAEVETTVGNIDALLETI